MHVKSIKEMRVQTALRLLPVMISKSVCDFQNDTCARWTDSHSLSLSQLHSTSTTKKNTVSRKVRRGSSTWLLGNALYELDTEVSSCIYIKKNCLNRLLSLPLCLSPSLPSSLIIISYHTQVSSGARSLSGLTVISY